MKIHKENGIISPSLTEKVLEVALQKGGDFAEIFVENSKFTHLVLSNSRIHEASPGQDCGAGIRVTNGKSTLYVYTSDLREEALLKAAKKASDAIGDKNSSQVISLREKPTLNFQPTEVLPSKVSIDEKLKLVRYYEGIASNESKRVTTVRGFYSDVEQKVTIANSEGLYASDQRNRVRCYVQVVVDENEKRRLSYAPSSAGGFDFFRNNDFNPKIRKLVSDAIVLQKAEQAPTGEMPVIIGSGSGGTLFHEACGHCLEADAIANNRSVFDPNKLGKKIASENLTVIDNGSIPYAWGSQNIDDEGMQTQHNVLIKNGILKNFLLDRFNGKKTGLSSNGCARRQSYRHAPSGRMTNTLIAPGQHSLDEMLSTVQYGLYAKRIDSGLIDTTTGNFAFPVTIGYLIKNGKIDKPVIGAQIVGNAVQTLNAVQMIGQEDEVDWSTAICRANSGVIQVTFALPPVLIKKMRILRG